MRSTPFTSGVLFSNAGTIVKFNRMGACAGFGDPWVSLVRKGPAPGGRPSGPEANFAFCCRCIRTSNL